MKIQRVIIDNFRNINHAEYNLQDLNIFCGPNKQGKTNTILAIYWAIADFLMDGSSDYASFKPLDDTKKKVSVELEFDTFKFKKEYFEKWTKTRGSETETMTGHYTDYYIDDIKTAPTNAKKDLIQKFGVEGKTNISKFDLLRAIIDPYYLAKNDWKQTRAFIIELVGDVKNEDIIEENEGLIKIKNRLEQDEFNADKTKKFYQQRVKNCKDEVLKLEGQIEGLELIKNVSSEDLEEAQKTIVSIENSIKKVKEGKQDTSIVDGLEEKLAKLQIDCRSKEADEKGANSIQNEQVYQERSNIQEKQDSARKALNKAEMELRQFEYNEKLLQEEIDHKKSEIEREQEKISQLREDYKRVKEQTTTEDGEHRCPNCNYVLNQDEIEAKKARLESQLQDLAEKGKKAGLVIENKKLELEKSIEALEAAKNSKDPFLESYRKAKEEDMKAQATQMPLLIPFIASQKLSEMKLDIDRLKTEIENEKMNLIKDNSTAQKLMALEAQKEEPQQVINQHIAFLSNQRQIENLNLTKRTVQREQVESEMALALVETFIQKKLEAFKKRIETVFGERLTFTLIEKNIKEGSWNEVCYPSVLDKETPFLNGSGSEQILAGIYIAERIKKKLEIEDLPYIFDECDKLDTQSLKALDTEAQIITTKVDDIHYSQVTLDSSKRK